MSAKPRSWLRWAIVRKGDQRGGFVDRSIEQNGVYARFRCGQYGNSYEVIRVRIVEIPRKSR